ncbi:hypothetical protein [uncultured Prochlorococcus sp.]|uniref:hypothetical protein n=1 Tax=uncultured Prochlorococcus sp. TaxID=159733 RepID=UPI00258B4CB6|nr:hypothetical protein [uncultured Prochlorococcus sp.]
MRFIAKNKISKEIVILFNKGIAREPVEMLIDVNQAKSFDSFKSWQPVWALEINRPELISDYILFCDKEPINGN